MLADATLRLSIQVAALVTAVWLLNLCLPGLPSRARYLLWLIVTLRLCVPLPLDSPLGLLPAGPAADNASRGVVVSGGGPLAGDPAGESPGRDLAGPRAREATPAPPPAGGPWLHSALAGVWLAVVVALLGALTGRCQRAWREVRRSPAAARPDLVRRVEELSREIGLRRAPEVRCAARDSRVAAPCVFGLVGPVLLLPRLLVERWSLEDLEPLLVHELVHIRRFDPWVSVLQSVVQIVYFFHPLVWAAGVFLGRERERACDDEVVRLSGRPLAYARSLLRVVELDVADRRLPLSLPIAGRRSEVAVRVARLAAASGPRREPGVRGSMALALTLGLAAALLLHQRSGEGAARPSGTRLAGMVVEVHAGGERELAPWPLADLPSFDVPLNGERADAWDGETATVVATVAGDGEVVAAEIASSTLPVEVAERCRQAVQAAGFPALGGDVPARWRISFRPDVLVERRRPEPHRLRIGELPPSYRPAPGARLVVADPRDFSDRGDWYRRWAPRQADAAPEGPQRLLFRFTPGAESIELGGMSFGAGWGLSALIHLLGWQESWWPAGERTDEPVLRGDVLYDSTATPDELLADLARVVATRSDAAVRLYTRRETRTALIVRGEVGLPRAAAKPVVRFPVPGPATGSGYRMELGTGIRALGTLLEVPLIDESRQLGGLDWWVDATSLARSSSREAVLAHVTRATGLELSFEDRRLETLWAEARGGRWLLGWRQAPDGDIPGSRRPLHD